MRNVSDISKSFFGEDWDIDGYFEMLSGRFWRLHNVFLREYGAMGDWIFWGLIFFLSAIFCIYLKLLFEVLKKSDEVLKQEIEEEYYETEPIEMSQEDENLAPEEIIGEEPEIEYQSENIEQNIPNINQDIISIDDDDQTKERIEMEKKLSTEIVQTSKVSDDYLNLRNVLYKQSKNNSEQKINAEIQPVEPTINDDVWNLDQTIGVIINMMAHNVSDKKIAQSIYFLNKGIDDAEDIIQLVKSVKNFIAYCNTGKFEQLPGRENLPLCSDALYALANGDNNRCMELMEALLNTQVALAQRQKGLSKELSYALAADYACTTGTLANLSNYELAINSFELALDLAPKNVNALSRCADLYLQDNNAAKAAETYQQVLNLADDVIYPEQKANANLKLAQYYKNSGKMFKADEMERDGRKFYDDYGIKIPLSDKEKETLKVLLSDQVQKMPDYIKTVLKM